jgi:hypothetical protein
MVRAGVVAHPAHLKIFSVTLFTSKANHLDNFGGHYESQIRPTWFPTGTYTHVGNMTRQLKVKSNQNQTNHNINKWI